MSDDQLNLLRSASSGLIYSSESDYPFDVFSWDSVDADAAQVIAQYAPGISPIEEISPCDFFAGLEAGPDGNRFQQLHRALLETLNPVRAFRVGQIEVQIFLIGHTQSGKWAGVHTVSVET